SGGDLAIGATDQSAKLGDRLLEVLSLLGQLRDVLARLRVLALGQRVDRADLLPVAVDSRELGLDRLALLVAQRLGGRTKLLAERSAEALELRRALVSMAAELRGLDLGHGHRLAGLPELSLQTEFLLRAFAELGGHVPALSALGLGELRGSGLEPLG